MFNYSDRVALTLVLSQLASVITFELSHAGIVSLGPKPTGALLSIASARINSWDLSPHNHGL